ncbi:hypothetical protein BH09PLA1_BH09PLA1_36510 [soil metagenome]
MLSHRPNFETLESRRLLSAGQLDPNWGTGGIFTGVMPGASGVITALAPTPDGKIMAAGTHSEEGANYVFFARFLHNGTLDTTFGDGRFLPPGHILTDLLPQEHSELTVLANGFFFYVATSYLARFTRDGLNDSSFGTDGRVYGTAAYSFDSALQPDGSIVLAGYRFGRASLARYLARGQRDLSFGNHGVVALPVPTPTSAAIGVHVLSDGNILAGTRYSHHRYDVNNSEDEVWSLQTARLHSDGTLDSTFGTNGMSTKFDIQLFVQFASINNNHAVFNADGSTLITWTNETNFAMCKFTSAGDTDGSWNPNAFSGSALLGGDSTSVFAQSDGKILLIGNDKLGRLLPSAATDKSFGNQGLAITRVNGRPLRSVTTTVGKDGSIYVGGSVAGRYIIARYWRDDAPAVQLFANDQTHVGSRSYRFSIDVRDDVGLDLSSIDPAAFRIITPDGKSLRVKLVSITPAKGKTSVATMQLKVAAPGGTWEQTDNGIYQVRLLPNLVGDEIGNLTAGRTLGTFRGRIR